MASARKIRNSAPAECPVCGADVPRGARACPACGADERTGWNDDETRYDGLDLPDHAFDDDPPAARLPSRTPSWLWRMLAILLILALGAGILGLSL